MIVSASTNFRIYTFCVLVLICHVATIQAGHAASPLEHEISKHNLIKKASLFEANGRNNHNNNKSVVNSEKSHKTLLDQNMSDDADDSHLAEEGDNAEPVLSDVESPLPTNHSAKIFTPTKQVIDADISNSSNVESSFLVEEIAKFMHRYFGEIKRRDPSAALKDSVVRPKVELPAPESDIPATPMKPIFKATTHKTPIPRPPHNETLVVPHSRKKKRHKLGSLQVPDRPDKTSVDRGLDTQHIFSNIAHRRVSTQKML